LLPHKSRDDLKVKDVVAVEHMDTKPQEGEMRSQDCIHKAYFLQLNLSVIEIINCEISIHYLFVFPNTTILLLDLYVTVKILNCWFVVLHTSFRCCTCFSF
jgi:hypothetical protein